MKLSCWLQILLRRCLAIVVFGYIATTQTNAELQRIENLWGGDVSALTTDANDNIYAVAAGKLFRSLNGGDEWMQVSVTDNDVRVRHVIAYRAADVTDYIVVGTDDGRLLRSADEGATWQTATPAFDKDNITALAHIRPDNIVVGLAREGLLRTSNHQFRLTPLPVLGNVTAIAQASDGALLIATAALDEPQTESASLRRSLNGGLDWDIVELAPLVERCTAMMAENNGTVYAALAPYGVMISRNNGQTWLLDTTSFPRQPIAAMARLSTGELYAGAKNGLYLIRETQDAPQLLSEKFDYTDIRALAVTESNAIFAATQGGITRKTDEAAQWQSANIGLDAVEARRGVIFMDYDFQGRFIASPSGIYTQCHDSWPDCVHEWRRVETGIPQNADVHSIAALNKELFIVIQSPDDRKDDANAPNDHIDEGVLLAAINADIYRSSDNGESWQRTYIGDERYFVSDFGVFRAGYGDVETAFAIAGPKFLKTLDGGENWEESIVDPDREIMLTAISNKDNLHSDLILVGTAESGIYRSQDGGKTWESVAQQTPRITAFGQKGRLIAGVAGGGAYTAVWPGDTWTRAEFNDNQPQGRFTYNDFEAGYVGTSEGLYTLPSNISDEWKVSTGMSDIPITDIDTYSWGGRWIGFVHEIFCAGTHGAYINDIVISTPEQPVSQPPVVWPTPANTAVHISYTTLQFGFVTLEIVSTIGQPVMRLINEFQNAGAYTRSFSIAELPAGVYTYRLRFGNEISFGTLVVVK